MKRPFRLSAIVTICCLMTLMMAGCSSQEPTPIRYGEDTCDYCRMTIVHERFGSELVTTKGKVFRFDSIECLAAFSKRGDVPADQVHSHWVTDYLAPEKFIAAEKSTFVQTDHLRSPMGMGLFGFPSESSARHFSDNNKGTVLDWAGVVQVVSDSWLKEK